MTKGYNSSINASNKLKAVTKELHITPCCNQTSQLYGLFIQILITFLNILNRKLDKGLIVCAKNYKTTIFW